MKKIFTLIVMAMMAVSINAKQTIALPDGMAGQTYTFGSWQWVDLNELFEGNEVAADATDDGVVYYDASAYDFLCIKYKECTVNTSFGIQYESKGTVGQWGPELYSSSEVIRANSSGFVGIQLDPDHKSKCYKVYVQSQGEGSMVIEEVYFATQAEYEADAAANPVVDWYNPTKELSVSSATNTWNDPTYTSYNTETGEAEIIKDNGAQGWWLGSSDNSVYKKLVLQLENVTISGYFQTNLGVSLSEGSYVKVINLPESYSQIMLQGGAGTKFTIKKAYLATEEYVTENNIVDKFIYDDTQALSLDNLSTGWNADYSADTKTITITGKLNEETGEVEGGGKGWWLSSIDYSYFDNLVIKFDPATTVGGKVVVQYVDSKESSVVEFYPGATCVVVPLDAEKKSTVQQIYVQGDKDATYTLSDAFVAIASATPEANVGTASGIEGVVAGQQSAIRYNLAGQRVSNSVKGIYIQNGKKFVVK